MKKIREILLLIFLAVSVHALGEAQLVWLNPIHDFGAFREEMGAASCTFLAVNTGDEPVAVIDARANCGCTRPEYNREPVAPGDTLRVSVAYDPTGRPGRFRKQVKVTTGAGSKVLNITGTVIGSSNTLRSRFPIEAGRARISNDVTPFGETVKGRVLAAAVNIYNPSGDTIVPAVVEKPDFLNVMFRPEVIPPGEQATLSLTAYTDRAEGWGVIEDSFRLVADSKGGDSGVEIHTVMIVNEDFSKLTEKERAQAPHAAVSEQSVDFGTVASSSDKVRRKFTITNTGKSPLLIRRVYTPENALEVKCSASKVKPGRTAEVTVTFDPSRLSRSDINRGLFNARITLITNDPNGANKIVRAVAEIKK